MKVTAEEAFHKYVTPFMYQLQAATDQMDAHDAKEFLENVIADVQSEVEELMRQVEEDDD